MEEKRFPIQGGLTISWEAAERAYRAYVNLFHGDQSLERLAERGGFGVLEYVHLYFNGKPRFMSTFHHTPTDQAIAQALFEGDVRRA